MNGWMDELLVKWIDGWMNVELIDRYTDGWMDGWTQYTIADSYILSYYILH